MIHAAYILAALCGIIAVACIIGLALINITSDAIMWRREALRWWRWPRR